MKKINVGIIGSGNISNIYFENLINRFDVTNVVACASLNIDHAKAKGEQFGVKGVTIEQLLSNPEIDIVVNLTVPKAHPEVCLAAINAGKSVYVEKPLAVSLDDAKEILNKAKAKGVLVGGAPDTFMGAANQTCRKLIDDSIIGTPVAACAFMMSHGVEHWHPTPEFYYEKGGGPMFDMGPYYLTALVNLLGPVKRVTGSAQTSFAQRTITSENKKGEIIDVQVPTHIAGIMDFESGVVGNIITSFDIWGHNMPKIEVYGSEGSIVVPNPNVFDGDILVKRFNQPNWLKMPLEYHYSENCRGVGVADMAMSLLTGRKHRASGELTFHVLEIMHGFHISSDTNSHYMLKSNCERPERMALNLAQGMLD